MLIGVLPWAVASVVGVPPPIAGRVITVPSPELVQ
jgi:hypothetical protein